MNLNNVELNVIVAGRRVDEFKSPMDFQTYIEGREGSNYEIELVNNNSTDCEFIVSVDGISITDGKAAGEASGGYVVPAHSTHRIPGWLVDGSTAAKFAFSGAKGASYAEVSDEGDERNKGLIATKVFVRKQAYRPVTNPRGVFRSASFSSNAVGGRGEMRKGMSSRRTKSSAPSGGGWDTGTLLGSAQSFNNSVASASSASASPEVSLSSDSFTFDDGIVAGVEQTLGTAFGEATDFATKNVTFERGDMVAMIVVSYDDRQGLKRRGIDVTRKSQPNPFPADAVTGCKPPANWSK